MTINNVPLYLIKYPWDDGIPLQDLNDIIDAIVQKIDKLDPDGYVLALPDQLSLEKITFSELENIAIQLNELIASIKNDYQEEEEE